MMKMRLYASTAWFAVAAGCGDSGPPLVPVSGTVTLNGRPLANATVSFIPQESNKFGRPAQGTTGPLGYYKAMSRNRAGAVPGKYQVVVSQTAANEASAVTKEVPPNGGTINIDVKSPTSVEVKVNP